MLRVNRGGAGCVSKGMKQEQKQVQEQVQEDFNDVIGALRALPEREGRDLVPAVMEGVRRMRARELQRRIWLRGLAAAACVAVFVGGGAVSLVGKRPVGGVAMDLSTPEAGAAWLLASQLPGGGWDTTALGGRPEHGPALTALGVLALHRQDAEGNRAAVLRGVEALCGLQNEDGSFGHGGAVRINQGLVTAVLLELNQGLHSETIGEHLAGALAFSRRAAAMKDGAWGYRADVNCGRFTAGMEVTPEMLEVGLQAEQNRFYRSCLAALALR